MLVSTRTSEVTGITCLQALSRCLKLQRRARICSTTGVWARARPEAAASKQTNRFIPEQVEGNVYFKIALLHSCGLCLRLVWQPGRGARRKRRRQRAGSGPHRRQTATLRGHIADPTGALIPGATIDWRRGGQQLVKTVTADAPGELCGERPGTGQLHCHRRPWMDLLRSPRRPIPLAGGQ